MTWLARALIIGFGTYLIVLGVTAVVRPERAKAFLVTFASSAPTHFAEMLVRLVIGAALLTAAPGMRFPGFFVVFGWAIIGTTIVLLVLPWRLHQRFAQWSVPRVTRNMPLFALGPLSGGVLVLLSLLLP
jgi:hypothetical protein